MSSFAEELAKFLDPVGKSVDPEDDIYEETRAKLIDAKDLDHYNENESVVQKNDYRRARYVLDEFHEGKVVSRKSLASESDGSDLDAFVELDSSSNRYNGDGSEDNSINELNHDISDIDSANEDGMDEEIDSDEAEGHSLEIFKLATERNPLQKKKDTCNQLKLWELLLESRIKCQETLSLSNKLPQNDVFHLFSDQVKTELSATDEVFESVLLKSLELQRKLFLQNSTTNKIASSEPDTRKRKHTPVEDMDTLSQNRSDALQGVRNKILKLWYDKTRLNISEKNLSKSFESFERTPVTQITDILQDKERLLKRTQSKRSQYRALGSVAFTSNMDEGDNDTVAHLGSEIDAEIFDDDDFYHQLLRHLIEQKSLGAAGSNDPLELSRLSLRIQSLRSKARKNVDTKASKGRKIRYAIHSKMQSFMASGDRSTFTHESRNEIYKSLFGAYSDEFPEH